MKRSPMRRSSKPMKRTGRLRPRRRKAGYKAELAGRTYGKAYALMAMAIDLATNCRCENPRCRRRTLLDTHHVVKRAQGGPNTFDNLVRICRSCHARTDEPVVSRVYLKIEAAGGGSFVFHDQGRVTMYVRRPIQSPTGVPLLGELGLKDIPVVEGGVVSCP